jgi:hypothetical protein
MTNALKCAGGLALAGSLALAAVLIKDIAAADHGDAPYASVKRSADLSDLFLFLDSNDNSRVVIAAVVGSPLPPVAGPEFANFDEGVRFRFELEMTGDAEPDAAIGVRFSAPAATSQGPGEQSALIMLPSGASFVARTTQATLDSTPAPPVITEDPTTGVQFFAGPRDNALFFDIPAEMHFRNAQRACVAANPSSPNPVCTRAAQDQLLRGRDSFAGYNAMVIALSVPVSLFSRTTVAPESLGVSLVSEEQTVSIVNKRVNRRGQFFTVDRLGVPTFSEFFIPYARRNEYNFSTPEEDAAGLFRRDIAAGLRALGTDATSIQTLLEIAVVRGDYLRLGLTTFNTGPGGGDNPQAAFPNGRRPNDDVIDTIVTLVNNRQVLGDSVSGNDVANLNAFPFFAPPHQPFPPGTIDDGTRH